MTLPPDTVGFIGPKDAPLTKEQQHLLYGWISQNRPTTMHHGDHPGAETQAHEIAANLGLDIVLHPNTFPHNRAFNSKSVLKEHPPAPYPHLYFSIIRASNHLLVAIDMPRDQQRANFLWESIRYALRSGRFVTIFWPDGTADLIETLGQLRTLTVKPKA
jgi:hypothetical protein